MQVTNPATGERIAELPEDTPATIADKVERARRAQQKWGGAPLGERIAAISRFRRLLADRREELAQTLTLEVGKPLTQSRNELKGTLPRIDFFLENVGRAVKEETVYEAPTRDLEERIEYEPLGVVANISAWNYPYFVGSNVFIPALLTGNAVLYKPSEFASLSGKTISELLHQAGVPDDVFVLALGGGPVGAALLDQPLNGVFFTGSYATGRRIAAAAAARLMKVQLELGGKDPVYVCDDVGDVAAAAAAVADGAFYNTGQSCCSVERVYVHRRIYEPFVDAFRKTVEGFVVGDPMEETTYIGPLTRPAHLAVLERQVADAKSKGARVLTGGARLDRRGNYFAPTVVVDVNHEMELMREESFGPLIGIQPVASDDEAQRLMNDTEYGLTAGVYSKDAERAHRILSNVNAGSAYWNCCDRVSPRLPWSGRGHSGIGVTLGLDGIRTFLQPKAWHLRAART
jgi:acyl-CoA reductase-like NAD-dependent aldehyde dehydrogenase